MREWRQLTANWDSTANRHSATKWGAAASDNAVADRDGAAEGGPATDDAFEWTESPYDTRVTLERAERLRDGGIGLTCVWSAAFVRCAMKATVSGNELSGWRIQLASSRYASTRRSSI